MKWLTIANTGFIIVLIVWLACNHNFNTVALNKVHDLELIVNTIQQQQVDTVIINTNIILQK